MRLLLSTPLSWRSPRALSCCLPTALLLSCHAAVAVPALAPAPSPATATLLAAPLLAAPQIEPPVLRPGGVVTLTLANFPLSATRLRVGLFEAGRPARVADVLRDFSRRAGRLQTTLTVEADPGRYELRLLSNDRARTPISAGAPLLVPGVDREPGWWLLNGSPFVEDEGDNAADASGVAPLPAPSLSAPPLGAPGVAANAPLFIPGLRRGGRKQELSRNVAVPSAGPLHWKTFRLPPLREMMASGYSFTTLRADLARRIGQARERGERNFVGFGLAMSLHDYNGGPPPPALSPAAARTVVAGVRQILNALAPEAALILQVDPTADGQVVRVVDSCAALCDAVLIEAPIEEHMMWPIKVARRVAEEQDFFDLPIFVRQFAVPGSISKSYAPAQTLELLMSGATGLINEQNAQWQSVVERNAPLFIGSVTLEDIGMLSATPGFAVADDDMGLYAELRDAGRIPLLARLTRRKKNEPPESFAIALGDNISNANIETLRAAAAEGARIYIEGAPLRDENGQLAPWRMGALVGGDAKLSGREDAFRSAIMILAGHSAIMILQDGWMFGTGRGTRVTVEQKVAVTLRPATAATQVKPEKGKDVLTGPRIAARLEDGTPALIINPVGKGEVIWMPHRVMSDEADLRARYAPRLPETSSVSSPTPLVSSAPAPRVTGTTSTATNPLRRADGSNINININRATPRQRYYAAVAAYVQPGLVSLRGTDKNLAGAEGVRVSLRRSAKGTPLLALFNDSNRPAAVAAGVDGVAGVALDLATERALPFAVRGFQSEATVTIPARGWKLIAFGVSRKALDDERNAPRLQARLR